MSKYKGFTQVELRKPKRSMFDMSHEKRLSTRIGKLTPIFVAETIPNDTFQVSSELLIKLAPLIAPIFHRLNAYVHFFFVPQRLLWEDWEEFITGGRLGEFTDVSPVPPHINIADALSLGLDLFEIGQLPDYFGIPRIPDADFALWSDQIVDARPFAAFQRVFYDYYRDRNYVPDNDLFPMSSGGQAETETQYMLSTRYRAWQHDYFTSALPWTQRGPEVLIPMEGVADTVYSSTTGLPAPVDKYLGTDVLVPGELNFGDSFNPGVNTEGAELRFTNAEITINEFRRAVSLQQWLERNALAGSRYNESIMAHFGRRTSDARLQRAEYLGGGKAVIKIDEIMTTSYSEDADTTVVPPGNPAGRGSSYSTTNQFRYNCEEHGFVIGVLSVMPTSGYMQGIPKMFTSRRTFLDYPWPAFAHLGEQPVYDHEIFMNPATMDSTSGTTSDFSVFGYQSRYSDWKHIHSSTHGDFRTTLDYWHLTRKFSGLPVLGDSFVTFLDADQDRIFNVAGVDTLWLYIYNQTKVVRSLPYFGTPKLV